MNWSAINWGSVADWVSGLGSFSAVIVALYLSRSAQRVRLRGYCGLRVILGGGSPTARHSVDSSYQYRKPRYDRQ
jgi:hypothetical protein